MKDRIIELLDGIREYVTNSDAGCLGCAYEDKEEWEAPCKMCKRNCKDYWRYKEKCPEKMI